MVLLRFAPKVCLAFVFALTLAGIPLRTDASDDDPLPPVRPTMTVQMGDHGGKFFGTAPDPAKTRRYFIAAENTSWDFLPAGRDEVCGIPLPPPIAANSRADKVRYVQYTDETFTARVIPNPALGILGPVLRGVVGEFLQVTFLNRTAQPLSMHPHGVRYDKDSEGAYYRPNPGRGAAVGPGAKFTYVWHLDESSGPLPGEPSSKGWLYHSHVAGDHETNLGLIGAIIVTDPKRARDDGTPADIDREFVSLFMIFDESGVDEAAAEAAEYAAPGANPDAAKSFARRLQLAEQGARYAINGYVFGNLPGLEANEGERTRWYLFALGSEQDFHTAHWHGLRVIEEGRRRTDVIELLPASMKVADLVADTPGDWLFHCHVAEHMREGMFARMTVYAKGRVGISRGRTTAFLGLPQTFRSIRLDRSEAVLNLTSHPARAELIFTGAVTAYDAFAVFNQKIRVQLGDRTVEFEPNQQGVAREDRAMLRITNANEFGVVRGPMLTFELVFSGADWIGPAPADNKPREVPLTLEVAGVKHTITARVVSKINQR